MSIQLSPIRAAPPRTTIQVQFEGGGTYNGPKGSTIEAFLKAANLPDNPIPVACHVDGVLRELTYPLERDAVVRVLTLAHSNGTRVYRRSLSFLLVAVARELFPKAQILIDYGLNFRALYCEVHNRPPFNQAELKQIQGRMRELVEADLPIQKEQVSLEEVRQLLETNGLDDKLSLLKARRKPYLTLYSVDDYRDYLHGYLVPSTGYLQIFSLDTYSDGFVLRYPHRREPDRLQKRVEYPKLVKVFDEYGDWMKKLGVPYLGALNEVIRRGDLLETILVAEALQEQRVAQIATAITAKHDTVRLVLISGPSSAGKTTFSKRLAIQLLAHGIHPLTLGLDNFIVDRAQTPRDEEGDYDFESLYALNLELFNQTLLQLLQGKTAQLPHFNFLTGTSEPGPQVALKKEDVIIIEGIHGLNPALVPQIPPENIYRIYVSALTQLNLDRHNRVPTTDTRLLRRIVRDSQHRGYTATDTLLRWPKVRRGEHKWIFPYQENANVMFNSALVYEIAVIKPLIEPLLRQVEPGTPPHVEVKRLLSFLQWIEPYGSEQIPANSLLREFIGGSILRTYDPRLGS